MLLVDHEIRALCKLNPPLLDPFSEAVQDGGVISYGCSHAGYDLRLGLTALVFKNTWVERIDPKAFKQDTAYQSRVFDRMTVRSGERIWLPPNGYILGYSLEYIRMPASLKGRCVGKCLVGESMVFNPSTGDYGRIDSRRDQATVASLSGSVITNSTAGGVISNGVKSVFRVQTKSGRVLRATENHPVLVGNNWVEVGDLEVGQELTSSTWLPFFGNGEMDLAEARLLGLMIADGTCACASPQYTKTDPVLVKMLLDTADSVVGCAVTKITSDGIGYRIVNHFRTGGDYTKRNRCAEWLSGHGVACKSPGKRIPDGVFRARRGVIAEFLRVLFSGDGYVYLGNKDRRTPCVIVGYSSASLELIDGVRHLLSRFGIGCRTGVKSTPCLPSYWLDIRRKSDQAKFWREIGFVHGSYKDLFYKQTAKKYAPPILPRAAELAPTWTTPDPVVSVSRDGEAPVYDIEVPKLHNFIANGLVVHNSTLARAGVLVNCTPLEPGWEGHLTIEIANATPCPVCLYAGEGVAQLEFETLSGTPDVLYGDKAGKYQRQSAEPVPSRIK